MFTVGGAEEVPGAGSFYDGLRDHSAILEARQIKIAQGVLPELGRLLGSRAEMIVLLVNGTVLTREIVVGGSFPREIFWVPSLGEQELSKEQAEDLAKQIVGD